MQVMRSSTFSISGDTILFDLREQPFSLLFNRTFLIWLYKKRSKTLIEFQTGSKMGHLQITLQKR